MSTTQNVIAEIMPGEKREATVLDEVWVPSYDAQSAHDVRVDVNGTTFVVDSNRIFVPESEPR